MDKMSSKEIKEPSKEEIIEAKKAAKAAAKEAPKTTRANMKKMVKNSGNHRVRTAKRIVKYGFFSFGRNIWLSIASALVMTITLLILFVTLIANVILTNTADSMRDKIDITIFFKPGTSDQTLSELTDIIKTDSNVKSVETANSEKEYEDFVKENEDDETLLATITDPDMKKILISSMQATMRLKVNDVDNLDSIKFLVDTDPTFIKNLDQDKMPTYDVNQSEIATITSWANIARNGGIILGAVFLAVSILVIFNTVRMAIFSRREEIYMMKLIGADKPFIRGPFLVEAQITGLISGVLAATLGYFGYKLVAPGLSSYGIDVSFINSVLNSNLLFLVYAAFILIGIIIGSAAARLAIQKYLNKA